MQVCVLPIENISSLRPTEHLQKHAFVFVLGHRENLYWKNATISKAVSSPYKPVKLETVTEIKNVLLEK